MQIVHFMLQRGNIWSHVYYGQTDSNYIKSEDWFGPVKIR